MTLGIGGHPIRTSIAYLQTDEAGVPVSTFVDFAPANPRLIHQTYPRPGDHNPVVRVGVVSARGRRNRFGFR